MDINVASKRQAVAFAQMVDTLFKPMPSAIESLLHAAIGMSGEAIEFLAAGIKDDRENKLEEAGDLYFYMVAANNVLGHGEQFDTGAHFQRFGLIEDQLVIQAGEIQDQIKKCWVYGKPLDSDLLKKELDKLNAIFQVAITVEAFSLQEVKDNNQKKLGKRFPEGVYSGSAALARADKDAEAA